MCNLFTSSFNMSGRGGRGERRNLSLTQRWALDKDSCLWSHEKTLESRLSLSREVKNYCLFILPKPAQFSGRALSPTFSIGSRILTRSSFSYCYSTLGCAALRAQPHQHQRLLRALPQVSEHICLRLNKKSPKGCWSRGHKSAFFNSFSTSNMFGDRGKLPSTVLDAVLSMGRCISGEKKSTRLCLFLFSPDLVGASAGHCSCSDSLCCPLGTVLAWQNLWLPQNMGKCKSVFSPVCSLAEQKANFSSLADRPFSIISGYEAPVHWNLEVCSHAGTRL